MIHKEIVLKKFDSNDNNIRDVGSACIGYVQNFQISSKSLKITLEIKALNLSKEVQPLQ